ncbi:response regulator [Fulvivirgaceae bacterium PWU5]|uniref:histidine kinase n=1 Tax=Dawidia cretensis TaxID=2782350 RepID=A0AAP2DV39_9BACT|nr:ATP-binding protein [Dawidia cretensis]MBT1707956.1 response regulator [Dawidia cretensis]
MKTLDKKEMEPAPYSNNTFVTDRAMLRFVVPSGIRYFGGPWQVTEPSAQCISPFGLPVSFDYLVQVDDSNHLIYPDDLEAFQAIMEYSDDTPCETDIRLIAADGQVKSLQLRGMFKETGPDVYGAPVDTDGAHHALPVRSMQEQQRLMEAVIQSDIVALSVVRAVPGPGGTVEDFEWVMANKLLMALAQGQYVVGRRYTEVFPSAAGNGVLEVMRRVLATGERESNEVYYENHNLRGWFRQVYVRSLNYIIVSAEDITLAKKKQEQIISMNRQLAQRAQEQYNVLFRSIDQGFAIVRMLYDEAGAPVDFVYLQVNPAFEKLTGLANVAGMSMRSLWHTDPQPWIRAYAQIIATQTSMRFVMPEGREDPRYYEVYAFAMGGSEGREVAMLLSDVTARQASERQLHALNERLQEADRAKTRFFGNVSHEFRTPLTLIVGPLRDVIGQGTNLTPEQRQRLTIAERNVVRLQKLVNSLLDFSRVEAGRLDAVYQPTRLAEFTAEIAANFRPLIEQAGLKLVIKTDPLPEPAYVNRDMWEKIVLNLLSNAFKFTHQGKIDVRVRAKKFYIQLIVRDTGIGIATRNVSRIFERFARFDNARGRAYEGSGIGLALVKELVEMHGGTIKVDSEEGQGTTFTVTIRKGKAHLRPRQVFETTGPLEGGTSSSLFVEEASGWLPEDNRLSARAQTGNSDDARPLILVAEDNADMRTYLEDILSPQYRVVTTGNGKTALEKMNAGVIPALILSDVMMPVVDGYGLVSAVRNTPALKDIPVILLSAYTGEDASVEGLERGATDFLEKPFSARRLRTFIDARLKAAASRAPADDGAHAARP